jgi:hypothetical protein
MDGEWRAVEGTEGLRGDIGVLPSANPNGDIMVPDIPLMSTMIVGPRFIY